MLQRDAAFFVAAGFTFGLAKHDARGFAVFRFLLLARIHQVFVRYTDAVILQDLEIVQLLEDLVKLLLKRGTASIRGHQGLLHLTIAGFTVVQLA